MKNYTHEKWKWNKKTELVKKNKKTSIPLIKKVIKSDCKMACPVLVKEIIQCS